MKFGLHTNYSYSLINFKFVFILIFTLCNIRNYYFYFNNNLIEIDTNKYKSMYILNIIIWNIWITCPQILDSSKYQIIYKYL